MQDWVPVGCEVSSGVDAAKEDLLKIPVDPSSRLKLSKSRWIHIHIYIYIQKYVYVYIYIHMYLSTYLFIYLSVANWMLLVKCLAWLLVDPRKALSPLAGSELDPVLQILWRPE